jgi:hypothetical protein
MQTLPEEECRKEGRGFKTTADDILSRLPDQRNEAHEGTLVAIKYSDGHWYTGRLRYSGARMPTLGFSGDGYWIELNYAIKIIRLGY